MEFYCNWKISNKIVNKMKQKDVLSRDVFSYNLASVLSRRQSHLNTTWSIIEKGSEKSNQAQRYKISIDIIEAAFSQISGYIWETPCTKISLLRDEGFEIFVKKEILQDMQSVKTRGVIYTLLQLSDEQKCKGVIAISTGSFALILLCYARKFDIPVTVVMPKSTTDKYVNICRDSSSPITYEDNEGQERVLGNFVATIVVQGSDMVEAHDIALHIANEKGLFYLDGNDHPNMIIGQATLGLEIAQQIENIDAVLLPTIIDGCGLTAGIAMAIKEYNPKIQIIEVQPVVLDPLIENIRKQTNCLQELKIPMTKYTWHEDDRGIPHKCWIDDIIFVDETIVQKTNDLLEEKRKLLDDPLEDLPNDIEFPTTIVVAAILSGKLNDLKGKRVVTFHFGEMDSSTELTTNKSNLEPCAGPSELQDTK